MASRRRAENEIGQAPAEQQRGNHDERPDKQRPDEQPAPFHQQPGQRGQPDAGANLARNERREAALPPEPGLAEDVDQPQLLGHADDRARRYRPAEPAVPPPAQGLSCARLIGGVGAQCFEPRLTAFALGDPPQPNRRRQRHRQRQDEDRRLERTEGEGADLDRQQRGQRWERRHGYATVSGMR
jgi:hypothetical protein